ncbi:MAG: hypothetical protein QOD07_77 [Frankiaceae bacterium]|jgi:hypothetical protein|nr:hypothetical protein [Frankiaceae bacterium]
MRLFRRRRRTADAGYVPYAPRHSAAWAQPAVPPPVPAQPAQPDPAVRLGFADGTEVELAASHPNAVALRAVADLLVQDPPNSAEE